MITVDDAQAAVGQAEASQQLSPPAASAIRRWLTESPFAQYRPRLLEDIEAKRWKTLDDFLKANRYMTQLYARKTGDGRGDEENDRNRYFPNEVFKEYQRLVKTLVREDKIFISDRKLVKLYKLFRVRSWLFSGGAVTKDDLRLLAYLGETHQEIEHLRVKVPEYLGDS